jgi:hypothetical protein
MLPHKSANGIHIALHSDIGKWRVGRAEGTGGEECCG